MFFNLYYLNYCTKIELILGCLLSEETKSSQQISKIKRYKFRPSIDSYIISTIKLNQVLRDKTPFEEVDFFRKSKRKNAKKLKINRGNYPKITTDEDARFHLKQFISIMAIHCGFNSKF